MTVSINMNRNINANVITRSFYVSKANQVDANKKIVRMSRTDMNKVGIGGGRMITIEHGGKKTVGIVFTGDLREGMIQMPLMMRRTINVKEKESVNIKLNDEEVLSCNRLIIEVIAPSDISEDKLPRNLMNSIEMTFKHDYARTPMVNGDLFRIQIRNTAYVFNVRTKLPDGVFKVEDDTAVSVIDKRNQGDILAVGWEDIGGLGYTIETIRNLVELPLLHPEIFDHYTKPPPKGILLKGPSGCGKTLIAKALASECNANFIQTSASEILSKMMGESEKNVKSLFDEAVEKAPSIIFLDEVETILPRRDESLSPAEQRLVNEMLSQMDGLRRLVRVVIIGATNRPNAMDPAARRPGRFEREIEIPPPDEDGRREIFQIHLRGVPMVTTGNNNTIVENEDSVIEDILNEMDGEIMEKITGSAVNINELARLTHGFVGADIAGTIRESVFKNLKRNLPWLDLDQPVIPNDDLDKLLISQDDLIDAMVEISPSALRSIQVEVPDVSWDDIGGLEEIKDRLEEAVIWNTTMKEEVKEIGIKLPKGIILYGPPGSGKTLLGKAVANESECNFIPVKGPEFLSKWVGQSEKTVRDVFALAKRVSPCIIFIDEFDSIAPVRGGGMGSEGHRVTERVVAQLLTELDGIESHKDVVLIASTNRPDIIDPAILRKGRIDRIIYVPAPDFEGRKKIFKVHLRDKKVDPSMDESKIEQIVDDLAKKTENYSGADIESAVMEAGIMALREKMSNPSVTEAFITKEHLYMAVDASAPSLDKKMIEFYDKMKDAFKKKIAKRNLDDSIFT